MARIMLIGDVGGCVDELSDAIEDAVGDPGTIVIQVGDLVDRGPDSVGVLNVVRERLETAPRRWIQLIGNHESQYLGGEPFWPQPLPPESASLLRTWWLKDWLRVAAAVRTADGEDLLVTHAGLTADAWRELGEPVTATTAADLLNTRPEELLWHDRGPLWAEAGPDLYRSWLDATLPPPFGQVHGHSTIANFARKTWLCPERIRQRATADWAARHTFARIHGARFIGIDPKHGRAGAPAWSPLVLDGATMLT
ncbi:MAG TPA: metallophosphoesterase [Pilimelia sp.]|nr:metallophosphoesterase [Pilimelia sp.]